MQCGEQADGTGQMSHCSSVLLMSPITHSAQAPGRATDCQLVEVSTHACRLQESSPHLRLGALQAVQLLAIDAQRATRLLVDHAAEAPPEIVVPGVQVMPCQPALMPTLPS